MKNVILCLFILLFLSTSVYSEEGINSYEYGDNIIIIDNVEDSSGQPCTDCSCNLTIYEINSNVVNYSVNMTNQGNGLYNATVPSLSINFNDTMYPMTIVCQSSGLYGVSSLKGIKIMSTMNFTPFAIIMIAITLFLAYISFKIEPDDKKKIWMKWFFLGMTFIMLIVDSFLGLIVSESYGIPGLSQLFNGMLWFTGTVFIIFIWFLIDQLVFKNALEEL